MNIHSLPQLYGSVKVGERGQVVIPQEARTEMGLHPGDKLLAMGGLPGVHGILLIKAESFSTLVEEISAKLTSLERLLRFADAEDGDAGPARPVTRPTGPGTRPAKPGTVRPGAGTAAAAAKPPVMAVRRRRQGAKA